MDLGMHRFNIILSDPPCKEGKARFTKVPLKPFSVRLKCRWAPYCTVYIHSADISADHKPKRIGNFTHTNKGFKGTVANRTFPSLYGESLEIYLQITVPLRAITFLQPFCYRKSQKKIHLEKNINFLAFAISRVP